MYSVIAVLLFLVVSAQGQLPQVYVSATGNSTGVGSSESPFLTLSKGLGAIPWGGFVVVGDGVYKGSENINLTIQSADVHITSANGPEHTIIDCEGQGFAFELFSGPFYITGFTIRNCYRHYQNVSNITTAPEGNYGGGAFSIHSAYSVLTGLRLQNNSATGLGGAIYIFSASIEIYNSTIEGNAVTGLGGGIFVAAANIMIGNSSTVDQNRATNSSGVDIFCVGASIEILDNESYVSTTACKSCSITHSYDNINICTQDGSGMSLKVSFAFLFLVVVAVIFA